jgi:hypothetical protein
MLCLLSIVEAEALKESTPISQTRGCGSQRREWNASAIAALWKRKGSAAGSVAQRREDGRALRAVVRCSCLALQPERGRTRREMAKARSLIHTSVLCQIIVAALTRAAMRVNEEPHPARVVHRVSECGNKLNVGHLDCF